MKPIELNTHILGEKVEIEIRQFKTIYTWRGVSYTGIVLLSEAMMKGIEQLEWSDIDAVELDLAKEERRELTRLYAIATSENSISDLICELSDKGVEAKSIKIPCSGDNCDEVSVEDLDHYLPIADLASAADYACDFEDGLCEQCHQTKEQEDAEEEMARMNLECREDCI